MLKLVIFAATANCTDVPEVDHATKSINHTFKFVVYTCDDGYFFLDLMKFKIVYCVCDGNWSKHLQNLRCERNCCFL